MPLPIDDVTTLDIRLKELRSTFDQAMRQEDSFTRVKELYAEIKELEYYLSVMNWDARDAIKNKNINDKNYFHST